MINRCIKTGADVWIKSQGAALHGDLYQLDDVYILKHVGYNYRITPEDCEAEFDDAAADDVDHSCDTSCYLLDSNLLVVGDVYLDINQWFQEELDDRNDIVIDLEIDDD